MNISLRYGQLAVICLMLTACVTSVNRVDPDSDIDISGKWNDVDSRKVSEGIAQELFTQPWYARYTAGIKGRLPVLIIGLIRNNSNEHINTETFTKDIEIAIINSGNLDVVASSNQQALLRQERSGQDQYASEATRKILRNELGADVILLGSINSVEDVEGRRSVRYYQIDLELIDIESNRKLWIGQQEIKKFVQKPRVRL